MCRKGWRCPVALHPSLQGSTSEGWRRNERKTRLVPARLAMASCAKKGHHYGTGKTPRELADAIFLRLNQEASTSHIICYWNETHSVLVSFFTQHTETPEGASADPAPLGPVTPVALPPALPTSRSLCCSESFRLEERHLWSYFIFI